MEPQMNTDELGSDLVCTSSVFICVHLWFHFFPTISLNLAAA